MKFNSDKTIRRLGIFFFYDKDGIVDDYILVMLKAYEKHFSELLTVCNGKLTKKGRDLLEGISNNTILVRENKGFDVWAYKTALMHYGWKRLSEFDEIVMFNFTVMGPVDSFDDMFREMNQKDLDFWGITIHNGSPFDPWGIMEESYIPLHLQSHFIAVRKRMFNSSEFHTYWENMPMINRYQEAVGYHEAIFTKHFECCGYTWESYVDTHDLQEETFYPLFNMPVDLIENRKCPIFKRKLFIYEYENTICENANQEAKKLYLYLKEKTSYNTDLIIKHLLRTAPQKKLLVASNLNYVIRDNTEFPYTKCACVLFYKDMEYFKKCDFHLSVLESFDAVYVVVDEEHTVDIDNNDIAYKRLIWCKGEGLSRFIIKLTLGLKDEFDYLCILNYSRISIVKPDTVLRGNMQSTYMSMMNSKEYINGVIHCFEDNNCLGMFVPPQSVHSVYFTELERKELSAALKDYLEKIQCRTPAIEGELPYLPEGGCYWIRTKALNSISTSLKKLFTLDSIENEQLLLPFLLQDEGFYTTYCMPAILAENLLTSQYQILELINQKIYNRNFDLAETIHNICDESLKSEINCKICFNTEEKPDAFETKYTRYSWDKKVVASFSVPKDVMTIKFSPVEGRYCVCKSIKVHSHELNIKPLNGFRMKEYDIFFTKNPQYKIEGDFSLFPEVVISMAAVSYYDSLRGIFKRVLEKLKKEKL